MGEGGGGEEKGKRKERERKHCPYQNHEKQNRGHSARFCRGAAESAHQTHFLRCLREDWGEIQNCT